MRFAKYEGNKVLKCNYLFDIYIIYFLVSARVYAVYGKIQLKKLQ